MADDPNKPRPNYYKARVRVSDFDASTGEATVECFDLIDALGLSRFYYAATALTYIFRRGRKTEDGTEDMRKASVYCEQSAKRER